MEKFEFAGGPQGPMSNYKNIHDATQRLEEDANAKSAVIFNARKALESLGKIDRFKLKNKDEKLMYALIERAILHTDTTKLPELEATASQAINKGLETLGLQKPGFANAFVDELKQRMSLH